jgi:TonB family protein
MLGLAIRLLCILSAATLLSPSLISQDLKRGSRIPSEIVIGRRTFFDFGPPFSYYDIYLLREEGSTTFIERINLTPPGGCSQPAQMERQSRVFPGPMLKLLGTKNPCDISEKALRREAKRCKNCLTFSGAEIAMRTQCGTQVRTIRASVLDRDMFDSFPRTPEHTSWTMSVLGKMENLFGNSVLDRRLFDLPRENDVPLHSGDEQSLADLSSGKYDLLLRESEIKLSELYQQALNPPAGPSISISADFPVQPLASARLIYPPIAKIARIDGIVRLKIDIAPNGNVTDVKVDSGHPMLVKSARDALVEMKFPADSGFQDVPVTLTYETHCKEN